MQAENDKAHQDRLNLEKAQELMEKDKQRLYFNEGIDKNIII